MFTSENIFWLVPLLSGLSVTLVTGALFLWVVKLFALMQDEKIVEAVEQARPSWEGNSWIGVLPALKAVAYTLARYEHTDLGENVLRRLKVHGNPLHLRAHDFFAMCVLMSVGLGASAAFLGIALGLLASFSIGIGFGMGIVGLVLGFVVPPYYLISDSDERIKLIERALPYALDLMELMIDGGATIPEAIGAVTTQGSDGPLKEEFSLVNREMQMGNTFSQAFGNFADRIPSDDLGAIVRAVNQGVEMGTPIASILKEQADLLRLKRTQRAEKFAKQAGSQMTFPIMLIMIATFLMVLGPAVLQFTSGGLGGLQ